MAKKATKKAVKKAEKKTVTKKVKAKVSAVTQKSSEKKVAKKVTKKVEKKATKKVVKKVESKKAPRKPNAAFMKSVTPSATLAAIIGNTPVPRTEVTKKIWDYIKKHKLQDEVNRRMINADEKLKQLFGKAKVSMFELTKIVSSHLS
jgi:upstream activation factor subunit UAF30